MEKLVDETHFAKNNHMESLFSNKETDCILYSEDGIEFNIHKEILGQTNFLRKIVSSHKDNCCKDMHIFCPCSKNDLDSIVNFLYTGSISCDTEIDLFKILNDLCEIFGFWKERFLPENYADLGKAFTIKEASTADGSTIETERAHHDTLKDIE